MASDLESLYQQARIALKAREYAHASELLRQILQIDENYKDTSRLLAQTVKLRRRRWYNDMRVWGTLIGIAVIGLLGWLTTKIPLKALFVSPITATANTKSTSAVTPTIAPSPTPTSIPVAWKRMYIGQEFPRDNINVIVFDPKDPDVIYVGTQNAGIYKSIDGGLSWQPAHKGLGGAWVSSLVIDPQDPKTLYAGIALGGIYKTTDGGMNWFSINAGIETKGWERVSIAVISSEDSQHIYYFQARSLYTSTNGGVSWIEILSVGDQSTVCPRTIISLAIDPIEPRNLFAINDENPGEDTVCKNGVYKSSDGGNLWTLVLQMEPIYGLQLPVTLVFDNAGENLYAVDQTSAFRSIDHGETWERMDIGGCEPLTLDPRAGSYALCNQFDRVRVTKDGGKNWQDFFNKNARVQAITISPHSSQTVFLGGQGLWITTDNGESWNVSNNGLGAIHIDLSFDPLDPSALLIEDERCTIYRSADGGRGWNLAADRTCRSRTARSATGEWLFWIDDADNSLRRSMDNGATSTRLNLPIENERPETIASHPMEANKLFALYSSEYPYIFISDDNGGTWRGATLQDWPEWLKMGPSPRVFYDHSQGKRVYIIQSSFIFRSDDAGESWRVCPLWNMFLGSAQRQAGMIVQSENADQLILATRGNGILVSTDGCQTWQESNTGLGSLFVNTIASDPNNPDIIYIGTDGGAYVSFDSGETWNQINDGLLGATVVYSIVVDKDSNVYAATPYGIFKLESR